MHALELGDRLPVTREQAQHLAPAVMDLHDPRGLERGTHSRAHLQGPRVEVQRGLVGIGGLRAVTGADEVGEGLLPVTAVLEVVGQLLGVLGQAVGVDLLDGEADRPVQLASALLEQALVRHVLDERVLEDVRGLGRQAQLVDDLEVLQLLEQPREPLREPGHSLEQAPEELPADDRGQLHGALAVLAQSVEASHDDALDGVGDVEVPDTLHHAVAVAFSPEQAEIEQGPDHLLDEEGHAFGLVQERLAQRRRHVGRAEQLPGHGHGVRLGQRVQGERGVKAACRDRRGIADPIREDQHERDARHRVGHRRQVLLGAGVDPVQVLEDQDQRTQARSARGTARGSPRSPFAGARLLPCPGCCGRPDRPRADSECRGCAPRALPCWRMPCSTLAMISGSPSNSSMSKVQPAAAR